MVYIRFICNDSPFIRGMSKVAIESNRSSIIDSYASRVVRWFFFSHQRHFHVVAFASALISCRVCKLFLLPFRNPELRFIYS